VAAGVGVAAAAVAAGVKIASDSKDKADEAGKGGADSPNIDE
jgi:hypothetical protein